MSQDNIIKILTANEYREQRISIEESNNNIKLKITGEVWINQIKELLPIKSWAYEKGVATFYM